MSIKKKAVGLQLLSRDLSEELVAILQVRSKWNAETNSRESYPGACQVTVHGELEEGENFIKALLREAGEELGKDIVPIIRALWLAGNLKELTNSDSSEKQIITYGAIVEENFLNILLALPKGPSFGGFRLIRINQAEQITDLRTFDKKIGVTDENIIAMFPDEKEAVRLAFLKIDF